MGALGLTGSKALQQIGTMSGGSTRANALLISEKGMWLIAAARQVAKRRAWLWQCLF
jgi:hypothetical protein